MAYGVKYFARILDFDNKITTINLLKNGYDGTSSEITHYGINPLSINYRSADKDDDLNIHGSEIDFNFYCKTSDHDKYDELFESEFRDWKVEIEKQQSTTTNTPIDLQTFTNSGSGTDWSNFSTNQVQNSLTSFFGAPVSTKRAYYPLYLDQGNTVNVDVAFNISASAGYTVTYNVGLLDSSFNIIFGSVDSSGAHGTSSFSGTLTLTATTTNAHYIYIQSVVDWASGTNNATIKCTSLIPEINEFVPETFWHGWIQPDNLTRKFVQSSYFIQLSATDGLAELRDVDYTSTTGGTTTAISIIKNILKETDLELPIVSQLNYITNNVSLSNSFLSGIYLNSNRFLRGKVNGRKQYMNCYDSLTYILNAFNCKISQVDGTWDITQKNEVSTALTTFDWDTLTPVRTTRDRLINIEDYQSKFGTDELTKVRPIKKINLTFYNKNVGESTVGNGAFDTSIDGWNNSDDGGFGYYEWDTFEWEAGRIHLETINHNGSQTFIESDTFFLDNLELLTGATVNCSVDYEVIRNEYFSGLGFIYFALMSGSTVISNSILSGATHSFNTSNIIGAVGTKATVEELLPFRISGTYSIRIYTSLPFSFDGIEKDAEFYFDNVDVVQQYASKAVYDKLYVSEGPLNGKQQIESQLYFSDGLENNSIGNIKYNSTTGLTTNWGNADLSVLDKSHQYLWSYEKMKMYLLFKNNLRITLKASSDEIKFNSILELDSKKYYIIGYRYFIQTKDIELNLIELLQVDYYLDFEYVQDLTSIDGQSTE